MVKGLRHTMIVTDEFKNDEKARRIFKLKSKENLLAMRILSLFRKLYGDNVSFTEAVSMLQIESQVIDCVDIERVAWMLTIGKISEEVVEIKKELRRLGYE